MRANIEPLRAEPSRLCVEWPDASCNQTANCQTQHKNPKNEGVRVAANWITAPGCCTIPVHFGPAHVGPAHVGRMHLCLMHLIVRRCCFHRLVAWPGIVWVMLILIAISVPDAASGQGVSSGVSSETQGFESAQERRAARSWLELEQEQRAYRNRVAPLDLKQHRQLEIIERSQQLDLRRLQQGNARELDRLERQRRLTPPSNLNTYNGPRWGSAGDNRRRAERHRWMIRGQHQRPLFHR